MKSRAFSKKNSGIAPNKFGATGGSRPSLILKKDKNGFENIHAFLPIMRKLKNEQKKMFHSETFNNFGSPTN